MLPAWGAEPPGGCLACLKANGLSAGGGDDDDDDGFLSLVCDSSASSCLLGASRDGCWTWLQRDAAGRGQRLGSTPLAVRTERYHQNSNLYGHNQTTFTSRTRSTSKSTVLPI